MEIIHENEYLYRKNMSQMPKISFEAKIRIFQEKYTYSIIWQKIPGVSL